jgi:hypothetical protein
VSFQARLVPELKERLEKMSYDLGFSQVSIVNAALEYYLDHMETGELRPEQEPKSGSVADGAAKKPPGPAERL